MNLPKRVQTALDAADAAEAAFIQQRAEHLAPASQNAAQVQAPVEPAPVVVPPVVQAPPAPGKDFEHQYRVLQGMYEADVTALKRQMKTMSDTLEAVQAKPAAPAPTPSYVEKDIETFGADIIAMVQRYAEGQQAQVNARLDALEGRVQGVSQQNAVTAEQRFFEKLSSLCPTWQAVNADPRWLAWLGQVDPVYGEPRQAALDFAQKQGNVDRVANVFNAFIASVPATPVADGSLVSELAPVSAGSPPPTPQALKPILTQKSITDFYRDVSQGKFKGMDAEEARIEAVINEAVAEGRVR